MKKLRTIIPLTTYKAPSQNDRNAADAHPIQVVDPIDDIADNNDKVFRGSTTHSVTAVNDKAVNEAELLEISMKALDSYALKAAGTVNSLPKEKAKKRRDMIGLASMKGNLATGHNPSLKRSKSNPTGFVPGTMKEEDLLEISKKVLGSYVQKAVDSHSQAVWQRGQAVTHGYDWDQKSFKSAEDKKIWKDGGRKKDNRAKGVSTAFKKVAGLAKVKATNEDVEQIDEISDDLKKRYAKKADNDAWGKEQEGTHLQYARGLSSDYKEHGKWLRKKASQRSSIVNKVNKSLGESIEFKVGDKVKVKAGPHQNVPHEVIHVFDDGSCNVKPSNLSPKQNRYHLGAAKATPNQLEKIHEGIDELEEGRLRAAAKGLGRFIQNLPAVPVAAAGGAIGSMPTAAITGDARVVPAGMAMGAAVGLGYAVKKGIEKYKYERHSEKTLARIDAEKKAQEPRWHDDHADTMAKSAQKKVIAQKAVKVLAKRQQQQNRIKAKKTK